jgi:hypothetical protein
MRVELHWSPPDGGPRTGTAAVDIIDSALRVSARAALRPEVRSEVALDAGVYLVRGRQPAGRLAETVIAVPAGAEGPVRVRLGWPVVPVADPPVTSSAEWFLLWHRVYGSWQYRPGGRSAEHTDSPGRAVAVQFGSADGPTATMITLDGLGPPDLPGTEKNQQALSLLRYLATGDVSSAVTVASEYGQATPRELPAAITIAVGHLFAGVGDPRLAEWIEQAEQVLPVSADIAVLAAFTRLRAGQARQAGQQLRRAWLVGLPVVPAGVRMLADGLAVTGQVGPLQEVRRVQRALLDGPLTTYSAVTPNNPVPGMPLLGSATKDRPAMRRLTVPVPSRRSLVGWGRLPELVALDRAARGMLPTATPRQVAALREAFLIAARSDDRVSVPAMRRVVAARESTYAWPTPAGARTRVGTMDLAGLRFAGDAGSFRVEEHLRDERSQRTLDCVQTGSDTVELSIRGWLRTDTLDVVYVAGERGWATYLITRAGTITQSGIRDQISVTLGGVRDPSRLRADDADVVFESVEAANAAGRDVWRTMLDGRGQGDPIGQAIIAGLS